MTLEFKLYHNCEPVNLIETPEGPGNRWWSNGGNAPRQGDKIVSIGGTKPYTVREVAWHGPNYVIIYLE